MLLRKYAKAKIMDKFNCSHLSIELFRVWYLEKGSVFLRNLSRVQISFKKGGLLWQSPRPTKQQIQVHLVAIIVRELTHGQAGKLLDEREGFAHVQEHGEVDLSKRVPCDNLDGFWTENRVVFLHVCDICPSIKRKKMILMYTYSLVTRLRHAIFQGFYLTSNLVSLPMM